MRADVIRTSSCASNSVDSCYIPNLFVDDYDASCVHGVIQRFHSTLRDSNSHQIDDVTTDGDQRLLKNFKELSFESTYTVCTGAETGESRYSSPSYLSDETCVVLPMRAAGESPACTDQH